MRYEIEFTHAAADHLRELPAADRAAITRAIATHLRFNAAHESKSRIKRLRGVRSPQYRLRVDEFRVFYDLEAEAVTVLAIVPKSKADEWLQRFGFPL